MKEALAMKFGGQLKHADNCDRFSPLRLGLVCPCCRRDVSWMAGQDRTHSRTGTAYSIGAHFKHPRATSPEEIARCTERVSRLTPEERRINLEKAKNKRSRLFRLWFWHILDSHWFRCKDADFNAALFLLAGKIEARPGELSDNPLTQYMEGRKKESYTEQHIPGQEIVQMIDGYKFNTHIVMKAGMEALATFSEFASDSFNIDVVEDEDACVTDVMANLGALAKEPLHADIVREAIEFLGSRDNRPFVFALWQSCISYGSRDEELGDELMALIQKRHEGVAIVLYALIGIILSVIPWGEEFSRLEGQSDLPQARYSHAGTILRYFFRNIPRASQAHIEENLPSSATEFLLSLVSDLELKGVDFSRRIDDDAHRGAAEKLLREGEKLWEGVKSKTANEKRIARHRGFGKQK